jgi:hypothetical protein
MTRDESLFNNYFLPLLVTVLLIITSLLVDLLRLTNFLIAASLFLIIGLCVFSAEMLIARGTRRAERQNAYTFITSLLFRERSQVGSAMLTLDEVLAIETVADEVWSYAYDLGWEDDNSPFPKVVNSNLGRGVRYRYIVPNTKNALIKVEHLQQLHAGAGGNERLFFRSRQREQKLLQFGITIYNPSLQSTKARPISETIVVFFPHYQFFGPSENALFLTLRGRASLQILEGFCEVWDEAKEVPARSISSLV